MPSIFITGALDPVAVMLGEHAVQRMRELVPGLTDVHVLPDVGHFVQMEAADEVNRLMLGFLDELR